MQKVHFMALKTRVRVLFSLDVTKYVLNWYNSKKHSCSIRLSVTLLAGPLLYITFFPLSGICDAQLGLVVSRTSPEPPFPARKGQFQSEATA